MFLVHLWNFIRGYVIILVTGRSIERFINICSKRQILLWDIVRKDNQSAVMKASLRGFRLMRPAAKKSSCRVHIQKRCGLPFFLGRFKKRKGFKVGLFIFLSLLVLSTSIIWDIEITGCKPEIIPQVMNVLNVEKIGRGSFKMGINPKSIASKIVLQVDGIAWVGVEIKGVKLYVSIEDSTPAPPLIKNNEFFDIVAERDGLVTQMEVFAGNALIKEGETVKKGQLLVTGRLQSKNPEFGTRDVHALGRIIARTWYECSLPVSMVYNQKIRTGKTHDTVYLKFLDGKIRLPGGNPPYEIYETTAYDKTVAGPFGLKLPIGLTVEKSFEIIERQVTLTEEEAINIAEETARDNLSRRLPPDCRVVDEKVNHVKGENDQAYIQVVLECEEDIAGLQPAVQNNVQGR
jgi:similar to stage IV sporulation protein